MAQWRIRASESSNSEEKHSNRKNGARGLLGRELEGMVEQNVVGAIRFLPSDGTQCSWSHTFSTQWRNKM